VTNKMNVKVIGIVFIFVLSFLPISFGAASASTAPVKGGACSTIGKVSVVKGASSWDANKVLTFTCIKSGSKKIWNAPKISYQVKTTLNLSQVWAGNSVTLSLVDSNGHECTTPDRPPVVDTCVGFYIGWRTNWKDENRTIHDNQFTQTVQISGLVSGDKGDFYIVYQAKLTDTPIVVKLFPFTYNTWE